MFLSEQEISDFLKKHEEVAFIDTFVHDICGKPVGKRIPVDHGAKVARSGILISRSMQLSDVVGETCDPQGLGLSDGDPDVIALPLSGTLVPVPWSQSKRAQVLCVTVEAESGALLWHEPRRVLQDVLGRFTTLGLTPVIAMELEFFLIDQKRDARGAPSICHSPLSGLEERQGHPLSMDKLDEYEEVLSGIRRACAAQGLPVTSVMSENAAGQFEINLAHQADILRAADQAALMRRAVRGAARQMGVDATFMAKPFLEHNGSGLHLHLSLLDRDSNSVFDPARPDGERLLSHAIAGLQATMH